METLLDEKEMEDPDYQAASKEHKREQGTLSTRQQDAKDQAIQRIERIIRQQFSFEIHLKEREIDIIDERISQTKAMLDRLRACVLAKYYGTSELRGNRTSASKAEFCSKRSARNRMKKAEFQRTEQQKVYKSISSFITEVKDSSNVNKRAFNDTLTSKCAVSQEVNSNKPAETAVKGDPVAPSESRILLSTENQGKLMASLHKNVNFDAAKTSQGLEFPSLSSTKPTSEGSSPSVNRSSSNVSSLSVACTGSRFYMKKRVIIGNTSKYIPIDNREDNDKSTHKWMVYVRGTPEDSHIERFIKKVWFFLHPSYRPNDIVEVNKPPFHLTRRGWGEFPVRVQLHFVDPRNKRVDIIHELKLDRTYTGLQTLGSETYVDLELDRRTFEDNCIALNPSLEESFATNLISVSTNSDQRPYIDNASLNKEQTRMSALVKFPASLDSPRELKKFKLESPLSASPSSVPSTPVNSQPASRCTSPEPESENVKVKKMSEEMHQLLRSAVKEHPLIQPERNVIKYPYCSSSVDQFRSWNIAKRRACEWQRAAAVRRSICRCTPSCKLSTKDILLWCRRLGYTPCDKVGENCMFCKFCGHCIGDAASDEAQEAATHKCEEQTFNSCTSASRLFSELEGKESCLPNVPLTCTESENLEVDVVGFFPEEGKIKSPEKKPRMLSLCPTLEQEWIREACSDIGISLKPVDIDGVYTHVVESLLLMATKRFADDIVRRSWAYATDKTASYGCRLVTPSHVHKAVCSLSSCDFLRNSYLGEEVPMDEK